MVLDNTYFLQGLTEVANQTTFVGGKSQTTGLTTLNSFITRYQKDFMYKLLGKTLADEYLADSSAAKWVSLDEYLFDTTLKVSPVANYVFYYYQQSTLIRNSGIGSVAQTAENSMLANKKRTSDVWNQMVDMMDDVLQFVYENQTDYPFEDVDWMDFVSYKGL